MCKIIASEECPCLPENCCTRAQKTSLWLQDHSIAMGRSGNLVTVCISKWLYRRCEWQNGLKGSLEQQYTCSARHLVGVRQDATYQCVGNWGSDFGNNMLSHSSEPNCTDQFRHHFSIQRFFVYLKSFKNVNKQNIKQCFMLFHV